jgi:hypothetical protein
MFAKKEIYFALLVFLTKIALSQVNVEAAVLSDKNPNFSYKIRYSFERPDGDNFWRFLSHDDSSWKSAENTTELSNRVNAVNPTSLYLRITCDQKAETINNLYFNIKLNGKYVFCVNGTEVRSGNLKNNENKEITVPARRIEHIGTNIYIFEFKFDQPYDADFLIEILNSNWISFDDGSKKTSPVLDVLMRDAAACKGKDGAWYLTGTTGDDAFLLPNPNYWLINPGIQVFRSTDLQTWVSLGYVWTFEKDGTWNKDFGTFGGRGPARGIFAPEIKLIGEKYWINYSVNHTNDKHQFGIGLLWADNPQGPYHEVSPQALLTNGFDSNLFVDDDGTPYLLKHGGQIARLASDFSKVIEPFRKLKPANYPFVGYEGVFIFKFNRKYYLTSADWNIHSDGKISYDSMIAVSDNIYGPYSNRYCAIRYGGHNSYFIGPEGNLYATVWCYSDGNDNWQKVSIIKMELNKNGFWEPY